MNNKLKSLDRKFEQLLNLVSSKSGISLGGIDLIDTNTASKEELLLNILNNKREKLKNGNLSGNLGLTRFISDWNFDKDIENLAYDIENYYKQLDQ